MSEKWSFGAPAVIFVVSQASRIRHRSCFQASPHPPESTSQQVRTRLFALNHDNEAAELPFEHQSSENIAHRILGPIRQEQVGLELALFEISNNTIAASDTWELLTMFPDRFHDTTYVLDEGPDQWFKGLAVEVAHEQQIGPSQIVAACWKSLIRKTIDDHESRHVHYGNVAER